MLKTKPVLSSGTLDVWVKETLRLLKQEPGELALGQDVYLFLCLQVDEHWHQVCREMGEQAAQMALQKHANYIITRDLRRLRQKIGIPEDSSKVVKFIFLVSDRLGVPVEKYCSLAELRRLYREALVEIASQARRDFSASLPFSEQENLYRNIAAAIAADIPRQEVGVSWKLARDAMRVAYFDPIKMQSYIGKARQAARQLNARLGIPMPTFLQRVVAVVR